MRKGISPLVASVLLIAITMAVAAILASWVSTQTEQTLENLPTCIGGSMRYASAEYPKFYATDNSIRALVQAQYVSLGDFEFEVLKTDDTLVRLDDVSNSEIAAGKTMILKSATAPPAASIKSVRITSNCSNVYIDFTPLR